jgi:hypothetical protein
MTNTTSGSCLCGNITYEIQGQLRPVIACHCSQCRKASGHHVAATRCRTENLTVSGDTLVWYKSSDIAERGFCRTCGSNLFWRRFGSENTSIFAGALDNPTDLKMVGQIYTTDKGDYYDLPDVPDMGDISKLKT